MKMTEAQLISPNCGCLQCRCIQLKESQQDFFTSNGEKRALSELPFLCQTEKKDLHS